MKRSLLVFGLILGLVFWVNPWVYAQSVEEELIDLNERIEELKNKIESADKETDEISKISDHLNIGGGITSVVQATAGNDDHPEGEVQDGSYSVDIELEIDLEKWGTAFIHMEGGEGDSVTDEFEALTGVNADALGGDNRFDIIEAWWEFSRMDEKLTLTFGKIDPAGIWDTNVVADDECCQFMADIFTDQACMEWPDYTPGIRCLITPNDSMDINIGLLSADNDWEDLFEDVFGITEINIKPKFDDKEGNYRFYVWFNALDHIEWDDLFDGIIQDTKENWGIGLSFDQEVSKDVTLFCRFGIQDSDIAGVSFDPGEGEVLEPFAIESSWSIGGQITGSPWDRSNDVVGAAIGQVILSDDYEDILDAGGIDPENEFHLEVYYNYYLNDYIAVSADIQVIESIGGNEDADTVSIFGVRTQISF
ncbi:MAG: carbohydrate porin [Thermodesulfobacteriota bacterium]|nr:carbohydrate porin [Thermodesulfobacteriota bacterium]